ncbi:GNAT family N-acetyltransferase [Aquicoccus sp. SCR17]|nr:GNAT family N-acetyltransferase [Carideicomes alvinocaridis]
MTARNLDHLLRPRSVALIGASPDPSSLGATVLRRLLAGGFTGDVQLVNPKYARIGERPCVASVADLAEGPDLGVIVTPPATVPGIIGDLGRAGARAAVVISAGFDAETRQAMLDAARPYCLRILGPNCIGLQVPKLGLDASFAQLLPEAGGLALLSQSGAIVTAMLDWGAAQGIGFSAVASMGDMSDVDVGDLLDHLATDGETRAILMYLEQVTDARKFMSAARAASRLKPVIAIKAGRSKAAARAASSHTGALAGRDEVYDAALRRAGILRVDDLGELFDAAEVLARQSPLRSDRLAVVTNGGGAGVLAADAVARHGVRLAELSPETRTRLDAALPRTWSHDNPVDIIGDADGARYRAAIEAVLDDAACDAVLVMNCPTGLAAPSEAAEALIAVMKARREAGRAPKPVLAAWLGDATARAPAERLEAEGLPVFETPGRAVRGFSYLADHAKAQAQLMRMPPGVAGDFTPDRGTVRAGIDAALARGQKLMSEPDAKAVLAAYGIPTVETRIAATPQEAERLAAELLAGKDREAALVVKILSPDITHKSDLGGVRVGLGSAAEVAEAARAMMDRIRGLRPEARIEGVVVQPMIRRPHAHELILGLSSDPVFGPVLMFGAGGTSVEVVADRALALPPLDAVLAGDMIDATRISRLMAGYRDRPAADREALIGALMRLSQLAADFPEITELDINPLLVDADGAIALDARIAVEKTPAVAPGGNPRFAIRPYPATWACERSVAGMQVTIRPIRPEDEALYPDFLAKVSEEDIRWRFGTLARASHELIARFTQIDYARAMAFVALEPDSGALMGVSRLASDPDRVRAEFAVLIRSDLRGRGLGGALLERLIAFARSEGIGTLFGDVAKDNRTMLQLCRELGFAEAAHPEDGALRRVEMALRPEA